MRSQRQAAPTTSPSATLIATPLAAAFSRIAARARSSISAASTSAAPARAQAIAAMPPPAAKSSTRLPATRPGIVQHMPRQRLPARPGETPRTAAPAHVPRSQSSVACQIGVISVARCRAISGTRGAVPRHGVGANERRPGPAASRPAGLHRADQQSETRTPARPRGWRGTGAGSRAGSWMSSGATCRASKPAGSSERHDRTRGPARPTSRPAPNSTTAAA